MIRAIFAAIAISMAVPAATIGIVLTVNRLTNEPDFRDTFKAACAEVGGKAVSNGRHLECIK